MRSNSRELPNRQAHILAGFLVATAAESSHINLKGEYLLSFH